MIIPASLAISARAPGASKLRAFGTQPVVEVNGMRHEFSWQTIHRFVMQPGLQRINVFYERRNARSGEVSLELEAKSGESVRLIATLVGPRFVITKENPQMEG